MRLRPTGRHWRYERDRSCRAPTENISGKMRFAIALAEGRVKSVLIVNPNSIVILLAAVVVFAAAACEDPKASLSEAIQVNGHCQLRFVPGSSVPSNIIVPLSIQNSSRTPVDIEFIICGWVTGRTNGDVAQVLSPPNGQASWHITPRNFLELELSTAETTNRLLETAGSGRLGLSVGCFSHNGIFSVLYQTSLPPSSQMPKQGDVLGKLPALTFVRKQL